jgi:hypothetical protein
MQRKPNNGAGFNDAPHITKKFSSAYYAKKRVGKYVSTL